MKVFLLAIFVFTLSFSSLSPGVDAQSLIPEDGKIFGNPDCDFTTGEFGFECVPLYIAYLIQFVFGFTGGFALNNIIFAGYQIATGGVTGEKEKGKDRLQWSLIGLALSVGAFLIVDFLVTGLLL